ncbi:hypothetical protein M408DRAFT_24477 [Serendipita vermifera MAFF 305830]|uniref:Uncharacterized protein n=1 Tax=Serendipita vermifera MAFF 305830 TaxID=933852 RepID=A0A0C3B7Y1_SERVB|nr:hypothetical protein M408DRAFT_24477 [Serendipita vermifera MAFF 305830]
MPPLLPWIATDLIGTGIWLLLELASSQQMFKRVAKRAKRREEAEKSGAINDQLGIQDTDSDESDSDQESKQSSDEGPVKHQPLSKKRKRAELEEQTSDEDEESDAEEDLAALSSMTVKEALKSPLEDSSCILCPGKQMKNPHMEQIHLQSGHHKRRLKRFEALVERLSSQFEDVYADQAALVVRLLEKPAINDSTTPPAKESNRARKRRKTEEQKEKRKQKKELTAARKLRRTEKKKRKKAAQDDDQTKA